MNIIDIFVILIIIFFGLLGWKRGIIKTIVSLLGIIVVFYLSFILKNPLAEWFSLNFPFFSFWGDFKGVTILNVVIYQLIAFYLIFLILFTAYIIIVKISSLFETILKATIILGIPSKILGFIAGILEGMVISVIVIMILALPIFNIDSVRTSKAREEINNTVLVSKAFKNLNSSINEIVDLKDKFEDKDEFNIGAFEILIKYNIITDDYSEKLVDSGQLKIDKDRAREIIKKYQ